MSQNEPKINPATGYVHDDSQLEAPKELKQTEYEAQRDAEDEVHNAGEEAQRIIDEASE